MKEVAITALKNMEHLDLWQSGFGHTMETVLVTLMDDL